MILLKKPKKNQKKVEAHKKQNKFIKITPIQKQKIEIKFYNNTWLFVTVPVKNIFIPILIFSTQIIK
jgi:hypothetical protein